jgi:hypothetical protein
MSGPTFLRKESNINSFKCHKRDTKLKTTVSSGLNLLRILNKGKVSFDLSTVKAKLFIFSAI